MTNHRPGWMCSAGERTGLAGENMGLVGKRMCLAALWKKKGLVGKSLSLAEE